jgi:hypothetical protein
VGSDNGNTSDSSFHGNPFNRSLDRSVSSANVPQRLVLSAVYELRLGVNSLLGRALLRGWQFAGIYTAQSGFPYSPDLSADVANIGSRAEQRALYRGGGDPNLPSGQRTTAHYFRTELFTSPPAYTFGNAGKNILTSDGFSNVDLTVSRIFRFREQQSLEFRAESFNLANHPTFGMPNFYIDLPTAGTVTSQANFGRQLQFALKFGF